mgnify:CR=1 FL=1
MTNDLPDTLIEAVRYFSDLAACERYMRKIKWPAGDVTCPHCGATGDRIGEVATRNVLRCKDCRKMIYSKQGTIFVDSPLGLDKWFVAVWVIANDKNGISSYELSRALGVSQKSAWFMLHRIRKAMETDSFQKFGGPAEADTTYIGGKAANMHKGRRERTIKGRGAVGKAAVHGVLQRTTEAGPSQVSATVVNGEDANALLGEVRGKVRYGAKVFTDEAQAYGALSLTHIHAAIDHSIRYVLGEVHTNGMENFWSLLKRTIDGTYVAVAPFHLTRYVAEQVFRFNERAGSDRTRFQELMSRIVGRRLTWRQLCAVDDAGFMGLE